MPLKIKDIKIDGYERVVHATDENTQLNCFIAIHNIKLGPALGGTRSWEYDNQESQLTDVTRLSEAMTLKNSVCGINFGGGKAALNLKGIKKTSDLYQSYGEAVQALKGIYISAGDVGTTKEDLLEIQKKTNYVNGIKDGPSQIYADNGQLLQDLNYKNGELDGHQSYYKPDGSLVAEGDYKNGRRIEDQN